MVEGLIWVMVLLAVPEWAVTIEPEARTITGLSPAGIAYYTHGCEAAGGNRLAVDRIFIALHDAGETWRIVVFCWKDKEPEEVSPPPPPFFPPPPPPEPQA